MSNSPTIQIEENVPVPNLIPELPLEDLKIGQSFVVRITTATQLGNLRQRLYRFKKANPPKEFLTRKVGKNEYRVWRIDDLRMEDD